MTNLWLCRRRGVPAERGSSVVGLVILTPMMATLLFFVVAAGRLGVIESKLTSAARSAARAASQTQSVSAAQAAAATTAEATLGHLRTGCHGGPQVRVLELDLRPGGQVHIKVSCVVRLSDLTVPGMPGSRIVSADSVSVVDRFRSGDS